MLRRQYSKRYYAVLKYPYVPAAGAEGAQWRSNHADQLLQSRSPHHDIATDAVQVGGGGMEDSRM